MENPFFNNLPSNKEIYSNSWQCQTLIDEVLASHSTDLQQRAYEFQALLGLSPQVIENVMPPDASCEDIEVFRSINLASVPVKIDWYCSSAPSHAIMLNLTHELLIP